MTSSGWYLNRNGTTGLRDRFWERKRYIQIGTEWYSKP